MDKSLNQNSILEESGLFWSCGETTLIGHYAPSSAVAGFITINENGETELELENFLLPRDTSSRYRKIHGLLKKSGKHVVIIDSQNNGSSYRSGGMAYEKYISNKCLVGNLGIFKNNDEILFDRLKINLIGYEEWFGLNSIEIEDSEEKITAIYHKPKDIFYQVSNGQLCFNYGPTGWGSGKTKRHKINIEEFVYLTFNLNKQMILEDVLFEYKLIQDLFILLTNSERLLDWPQFWTGDDAYATLYYKRTNIKNKTISWDKSWVLFTKIHTTFGKIYDAWRSKREQYGPGFYLYLGTKRGMDMYLEHKFVNLIWGIESLHRQKDFETGFNEKLKLKIDRIISDVKLTKDKDWLAGRLANAHEPNLAQRIFVFCMELPFYFDKNNLENFCNLCAKYRNDISHFGGQRQDQNYDDFLIDVAKKEAALDYLFHAFILNEIGVNQDHLIWWFYEGFNSYRIKETLRMAGIPLVPRASSSVG